MSFVLLVLGFAALIKGADVLIDSASKLAKMLAVPSFIIGFTVLAFGTSAPELIIGIVSGLGQTNLITLGDVIGSCIANIALIIGITAIIHPLSIEKSVLYKEIPISFGVQLILSGMLFIGGILSRIDAAILLVLFAIFLFYIFKRSRNFGITVEENGAGTATEANNANEGNAAETAKTKIKLAAWLIIGIAGVIAGGNLVVNSSTAIAHRFGLSDVLIGATIVALGTSLPELVTSVVAAIKKQSDIAIGNIIGSNIFNILFVLGVSSIIHPIKGSAGINVDIAFMLFATLLAFLIPLHRKTIYRSGGIALIIFYAAFILYKVFYS